MSFATADRGRSAGTTPAGAGGNACDPAIRASAARLSVSISPRAWMEKECSGSGRIIQPEMAMKIYTRTGDTGETSLFDGTRVSKADDRVDAYGEIDELNAWLGLERASAIDPDLDAALGQIQRDLFGVGAELADPGNKIA